MIPYVLLIFLPLIVPTFVSKYRFKYRLSTKQEQKDSQDILLPLFFTLLIILLALRDETIGRDLPHYKRYFYRFSSLQFIDIFDSDSDVLYVLLNWLIGRFTDNYQVFLSIVAIICVLPIAFIYNESSFSAYSFANFSPSCSYSAHKVLSALIYSCSRFASCNSGVH